MLRAILFSIAVPFVVGFTVIICVAVYQSTKRNNLITGGASGVGLIQTLTQTSGRVGGMPIVAVAMQVTPQQGAPFQAVAKQVISPANAYAFAPGLQVPVKFDPDDHDKIIILTGGN
jgi:hypothetical protein